jgi:hypothetical protein
VCVCVTEREKEREREREREREKTKKTKDADERLCFLFLPLPDAGPPPMSDQTPLLALLGLSAVRRAGPRRPVRLALNGAAVQGTVEEEERRPREEESVFLSAFIMVGSVPLTAARRAAAGTGSFILRCGAAITLWGCGSGWALKEEGGAVGGSGPARLKKGAKQ